LGVKQQFGLHSEHIDTLAIAAIGSSQALRGQMIFSAIESCHFAALFQTKPVKCWNGRHTGIAIAEKVCHPWRNWPQLKQALSTLSSEEFNKATMDFRNQNEHGGPIEIGVGITTRVRPTLDSEGKSAGGWTINDHEALQLPALVPYLKREHELSLTAFNAYVDLIEELIAAAPKAQSELRHV
jgi:hypothetical protein